MSVTHPAQVTEVTGGVSRSLADKLGDVVSVRDFGAKGDGTTDDTAAIRAAIDAIKLKGDGSLNVGVVYFPESPQPYPTDPIALTDSDRQVVFVGDSVRGSRISIKSAGTYGISFGASANSWCGLRNIRVETSAALSGALVYVNNPSNAVIFDHAYLHGQGLTPYCLTIDGISGVGIVIEWAYTTGATAYNFRATNLTGNQFVVVSHGNHDVGTSGILSVEAASSSGGVFLFDGVRFEGIDSKSLFHFSTNAASWLRVSGSLFVATSATAATAFIEKATGTATPTYFVDPRFSGVAGVGMTNIYVDLGNSGNNIAAVANDVLNPIFGLTSGGYIHFGARRLWIDANGRLRQFLGAPSADTSGYGITPRRITPTYGTTVTVDSTLGDDFTITPTDGVGFTISSPTNASLAGQQITIRITNTFGTLGAATWGGQYRMSAWTQPANGFTRSITFAYDGSSKWFEVARTPADVPN